MAALRILGVFTIIPATLLLTVSFFVVFALQKVTKKSLRMFGLAIVTLLWVAAAVVFTTGMLIVSNKGYSCHVSEMARMYSSWGQDPHHSQFFDPHHGSFGDTAAGMDYDHHRGMWYNP